MLRKKITAFVAIAQISACLSLHAETVKTINLARPLDKVTVEYPLRNLGAGAASSNLYVTDSKGNELPSQVTHDNLLVFKSNGDSRYVINSDKKKHEYAPVCTGRLYPERHDDLAFENNRVAFRIYGPTTQRRNEKAYGYDIFCKYPTEELVLEGLYEPECNGANWRKVDSLRKVDPKAAEELHDLISYHIDKGKGMDIYAVGPTLGDGCAALVESDSLRFAWCFDKAEVLDQGPVRFTARLTFAPRDIPGIGENVVETRYITLDRDNYLNRCTVRYDGLNGPAILATGFPIRDESPYIMEKDKGLLAYPDPLQTPGNGKVMLGAFMPKGFKETKNAEGHVLGYTTVLPSVPLTYYWGYAWTKGEMEGMEQWLDYLAGFAATYRETH